MFDSGYGGLTILRCLQQKLPALDFIYLGDSARAPYGNRDFDSVYRFTLQAVRYLFSRGCRLVILACNTASAKALRTIQQHDLPLLAPERRVLGVIRPTAETVGCLSSSRHVGLVGTAGTVASHSYDMELAKLAPDITLSSHACPEWASMVENSSNLDSSDVTAVVGSDLDTLLSTDPGIDTLILGCTHYPLLINVIRRHLLPGITIIDQGPVVAHSLADYLRRHPEIDIMVSRHGKTEYLTTGDTEAFNSKASIFMAQKIAAVRIALP